MILSNHIHTNKDLKEKEMEYQLRKLLLYEKFVQKNNNFIHQFL